MSSQNDLIKINEIVAECTKLLKEQTEGWQSIVREIKNVNQSAPSSYIKMQKEIADSINKIDTLEKKYQVTVQKGEALQTKVNNERLKEIQIQKKREDAIDRYNAKEAKAQQQLEKSANTYQRVNDRVRQLTQTYNDLATRQALGQKLDAQQLTQLAKLEGQLKAYDKILKQVDATVGKNQRNVGNYKSGFDGLGNSINQITRELPAFTFSAQTGFMALSNNIPILADEIQRVSNNVKEMRAQGQQVPGVMSQILTSFLSWQTLLSLTVTLITVYGKEIGEFISTIFEGAKKVDVAKISLDAYNKALEDGDYKKVYSDVLKVGIAFEQASKGTLQEKEALETFNNTLGEVMGKTNNFEKAKQIYIDKQDDYIAATLAMASANYLFAQSAELNAKMMTLNNKEVSFLEKAWVKISNVLGGGAYSSMDAVTLAMRNRTVESAKLSDELEAGRKAIESFFQTYKERSKDLNMDNFFGGDDKEEKDKMKEILKSRLNALYELKRIQLERQRDEAKFAEDNEIFFVKELELEQLSYDNKVALAKLEIKDKDTLNTTLDKLREENLHNIEKLGRDEINAETEVAEKIMESIKKYLDFRKKATEEARKERDEAIKHDGKMMSLNSQIEIEKLGGSRGVKYWKIREDELNNWHETEKRLNANNASELLRIEKEYQLESIKLNNERKEAFKSAISDMYSSALGEFGAGSLAQFFNGQFEEIWAGADTLQEKMAAVMMAINQISADVFNAMSERQNAYYERQFANLEKERDIAIGFAGESTAGREAIEKQYDEKKRALQMEQAKREKRMAIAQANINIASAILGALTTQPVWVGIAMAALVGVLGAVQLATIASTPLPAFEKGTQNAPEGWAVTQEKGAEMITDKNGNIKTLGNNKGNQLTYLNKGDKVFTADETTQKLNELLIGSGVAPIVNTNVNNGLSKEDMFDVMQQTLSKQPRNTVNIDEQGFKHYIERSSSRVTFKNKQIKIG